MRTRIAAVVVALLAASPATGRATQEGAGRTSAAVPASVAPHLRCRVVRWSVMEWTFLVGVAAWFWRCRRACRTAIANQLGHCVHRSAGPAGARLGSKLLGAPDREGGSRQVSMDRIAKIISGEMFDLIQTCYLGPKLRQELPGLASSGDCAGILTRCQNLPPNVGQGIRSSEKKLIEDVLPELVRLHRIYEAIKRACSVARQHPITALR